LFGRNNNPCGYDTLLITLLLGNDLVHLSNPHISHPFSFEEASKSNKWRDAMRVEIESIEKNKTWELTVLPNGMKLVGVKWIYKTKLNENGEIDKYKARLMVKGYAHQYGVDYTEVFALDKYKVRLALTVQHSWDVFQLDVKSAFLHGELNEEVFVKKPLGYEKVKKNKFTS